jgi:hypothetical protein
MARASPKLNPKIRGDVRTIRIKPGKSTSFITMIGGVFMIGFGIAEAIPTFGTFGVLWTLMAVAITVYSAFNATKPSGTTTPMNLISQGQKRKRVLSVESVIGITMVFAYNLERGKQQCKLLTS